MSYTVLARKYRPQTFDDLVGQEHVARTLANAIDTNRVAHAFIFTGVRGVGKTTTARLLAKALNCEKGPTATPCNECAPCKEITAGVDMDVQEMDGASNNSVEDVRRLQESIPYRPARDRFKIVIVDEVHMLSSGAFNAFLKTLEEPPAHVKFIFATTESHKVPITIRSRCQRYDFRLIPQKIISERVKAILSSEGIEADEPAITIVAREAAGSMRDALTLLDQIVAFGGESLRGDEVAKTLGIAGREAVLDATKATLAGDGAGVLRSIDKVASQGVDMLHFSRQLLEYLRELTVLKVTDGDAGGLSDLVEEEQRDALAIAEETDVLELQRAFAALAQLVEDVGRSSAPRTVLEMGLLRIATRPPLKQVGVLLARLDALEKSFGGGGGGGGGGRRHAQSREREPASSPTARASEPDAAPRAAAVSATAERPSAKERATSNTQAEPEVRSRDSAAPRLIAEVPAGDPLLVWERSLGHVREARPALAAILEHGVPLSIAREELVLAFPSGSFFGKQAESRDSKEGIAAGAAKVIGGTPEIVIRFTAEAEKKGLSVAEATERKRTDTRDERKREALSHPRVQEALQIFPEGAGNVKVHVDVD
jgi:DNA polymerase-3 subunit gamma/tau